MKHIPNLFTLLNLFFGCLAIVAALQAGLAISTDFQTSQTIVVLPERIFLASLFIGIAALIDFLDGFVARLFNATSDMGKQLDSLADVVSFGVAPGIIIYQFLRLSFAQDENGLEVSTAWLLPAFVLPCAAAWRLARFNLEASGSTGFRGLPSPAAGLLVASFPLIYWSSESGWVIELLMNEWFWYAVVALLSYLMVSTLPMLAMKFSSFRVRDNLPRLVLVVITVVAAFILQWLAVPVVFLAYLLISLAFKQPK